MVTYVIAQMQVNDPQAYREYAAQVDPSSFGGRILVAADMTNVIEGERPYPRTVIGEFPTVEAAKSWYESEQYQSIVGLRQESSTGTVFIVEGFSLPPLSEGAQT